MYKNSVEVRVFTAEWWISMSVILNRTPSVQGGAGISTTCTKSVGDVQGPPPCSFTAPHSGCTKVLLAAEVHHRVVHCHEGRSELQT